ncbi:hypothetical protein VaNZ11_000684 [Volvox africanus]|uniref:Uncharacterized protein n=1 Tax=Volvox africanus TaxID=51714 RepID=A0ABQ5RMV8_9CHLO|nr:hypothetical protein VaNZ11_000684 [Volvox africanus]
MEEKEVEKRPEDEAEDDDEEDDDEERSDSASTTSTSTINSVDSSSKKKRKKKKKKKKGKGSQSAAADAAQAPQPAAQPALTKAQKAEAEKRFTAALDACRGNSEMWVKLGQCNIFDAKAKKLADVLRGNICITSLDLSGNNISDDGAVALASMLSASGAPELIELDLRDNPLSSAGTQALEALSKTRKQLVVKLGSLQQYEAAKPSPASAGGGKDSAHGAGGIKEITKGPMFRKYFQTGDDDDDAAAGQGEQEGPLGDGGLAPEDLWSEVKTLVVAGTASIPKLSSLLQQLITHLNRELGTLQVPHTDAAVDGSRPHIKGCILNLDTLGSILDLVPRQVTMQYVSEPQPAVGSHRVWATEIVSMLLAPNHMAVDNLVASSKLVPRVLALSLAHPICSALHTRVLRVLRSCCVSKVAALYGPLFTAGMGAGLTVDAGSEELCGSLQQQLAERASPSLGIPSGRRDPSMGFVLEACKVLRACCDEANRDSILNTNVRRLLLMDPKWSDFMSEGGVLAQLCKEQEGDLGGPRAARVPLEESNELAELAGGGLISSHEILALLHGMSALGIQTSTGQ